MRKNFSGLMLVLLLSTAAAWAGNHDASAANSERTARIAGGQTVALAESAKSGEEWAKERPHYRDLRPKKR